ncbi:hypothetical protein K1719_035634 [Acacia pycnantha]|nr:hypothetical protein K1719_035634 [Acacia pycnantha]
MACKLRKAIGAMKDQTSIGLAMVRGAANLEVNILKATTHNEIPMNNRILQDGDPYFPREIFHAMKQGTLRLLSHRKASTSIHDPKEELDTK